MFLSCFNHFRGKLSHTSAFMKSVTIPDAVYVIDTGRVREVRRNKRTSTSMLVQDFICKSSAKQRQGRAGRVQPGVCKCPCFQEEDEQRHNLLGNWQLSDSTHSAPGCFHPTQVSSSTLE